MTHTFAAPSSPELRIPAPRAWPAAPARCAPLCSAAHGAASAGSAAAFGLLLLATGDLLFRPADLIARFSGFPIHKLLLVPCTLLALPRLLQVLTPQALRRGPITLPLLLLVVAVVMSHLSHGNTYDARIGGIEVAKACLFALLVVALVDSLERLRWMLWTLTAAVGLTACLAIAQHHGLLRVDALAGVEQSVVGAQPQTTTTRLCGIGVFHDPNDFSLVLVLAMTVCAGTLWPCHNALARWLLLAPLAVLGYALLLTQSRGGGLSAATALTMLVALRLGWRNAFLLSIPLTMLSLGLLSGRGLNLDNPADTFQTRLRLWDGSIDAFLDSPVFGIGQGKLVDSLGQVAHNSFLHAFAEMGFIGGSLFLGAFCLLLHALWRMSPGTRELVRMRLGLLAGTMGYAAGLLSLSRCYIAPTYLVLALGAACVDITCRAGAKEPPPFRLRTLCLAAVGFLGVVHLFVQFMLIEGKP